MENVTLKILIVKKLQDIFSDVKWANHLIEEGKEVPADRKLQATGVIDDQSLIITHCEVTSKLYFEHFLFRFYTAINELIFYALFV